MFGKETMTSRERVLKAINHEIPDRVPIDMGGFQTGIHRKAYIELLKYLNLNEEVTILDPVQQLAKPSEEVLKKFHVDTRYICPKAPDTFTNKIERVERNGEMWHSLTDEFGVTWAMPEKQELYMDIIYHPLADATIEDIRKYPFPKGDDPTRFTDVRKQALKIREETDCAVCTGIAGVVYEICWYMRGLQKWFIDMMDQPLFCEALLDKTTKFWMDFFTCYMKEAGDLIDVIMIGDDLAGQRGPLFSPVFYKEIVKPRQKKLVQHIKSLTDAKIWYHTCGSCLEFIPELIDNGVDILNPVQISAKGMSPKSLKEKFGSEMVFWGGGIDSQHVLPIAKPEDVREHVKKNIQDFMSDSGYVFNNVHNIQYGIPPENIIALFDAAYEFGFYK